MANTTIDALKPGQSLKITITRRPRTDDAVSTLERLMRQDVNVKRGLRKSHRRRQQNLNVYIRGNRDWTSREKCGKLVRVEAGQSWTMPFFPQIAPDLRAVQSYLTIEPA